MSLNQEGQSGTMAPFIYTHYLIPFNCIFLFVVLIYAMYSKMFSKSIYFINMLTSYLVYDRYDFRIKQCSVRLYLQCCLSCLHYFVCLRIVVSNTYCVVFSLVFLHIVYSMLPVSLDCQFLIAHSVFS